jgi:hypothetical protein
MKKKKKEIERKVLYEIDDKRFGMIPIYEAKIGRTGEAWWKDRVKVEQLLLGYRLDCKIKECRYLAGISKEQQDYFLKIHPHLCTILAAIRKEPTVKARTAVIMSFKERPELAFKYLERKEADEFKERKDITSDDKPILVDDL